MEHLDLCPFVGTVRANDCEWCRRGTTPCWVTDGGEAFHAHSDCPVLQEGRTQPLVRETLASVMGRYPGCAVCVHGFCTACAVGRHERCSPKRSVTGACACADGKHRGP